MFCFGFLRIFGKKSQKSKKKILGTSGFYTTAWDACHGKAEVPKMEPSDMPQRSFATPRQRAILQCRSATPQRSSSTSRRRYCS